MFSRSPGSVHPCKHAHWGTLAMHQSSPQMLTITEAVAASRIGRTALYGLIRDGKLDARKLGRRTLVPAAALRRLLERLPSASANRSARALTRRIEPRHVSDKGGVR